MRLIVTLALLVMSGAAYADTTCKQAADEKKLAGAALASFTKKCERDAKATCEKSAAEKKLNGAAKNSFVTKCAKDAAGA
jgi:hypothetical protein